MNHNNSIPVGLQDLLTKLDFLAQITRGCKPCMTNMTFVESDSWAGSFYRRYWVKETRKSVISDIEKIVGKTIDSINAHKDTPFLNIIINALSEAKVGIESLRVTYRDDPEIKSRVSVQLKNIDLQLDAHRHLIKGYDKKMEKSNKKEDKNKLLSGDKPTRRKMKLDENK